MLAFLVSLTGGVHVMTQKTRKAFRFLDSGRTSNIKKNQASLCSSQEKSISCEGIRHLMLKDHLCLGFQGASKDINSWIYRKLLETHNMKNERNPELKCSCWGYTRDGPNNFVLFLNLVHSDYLRMIGLWVTFKHFNCIFIFPTNCIKAFFFFIIIVC